MKTLKFKVNSNFADRLLASREVAGLSQAELAARIGVSQSAIGQWERSVTAPRSRNVNALAVALAVDAELLRNGTDPLPVPAPVRTSIADELLMAELIIVTMQGAMTADQRKAIQDHLAAAGIAGADPIRSQERRAAIVAGGAA